MTIERRPFEWEVDLQSSAEGKTITEKVFAYWSTTFDGIKESIALAAL